MHPFWLETWRLNAPPLLPPHPIFNAVINAKNVRVILKKKKKDEPFFLSNSPSNEKTKANVGVYRTGQTLRIYSFGWFVALGDKLESGMRTRNIITAEVVTSQSPKKNFFDNGINLLYLLYVPLRKWNQLLKSHYERTRSAETARRKRTVRSQMEAFPHIYNYWSCVSQTLVLANNDPSLYYEWKSRN